MDRDRDDETKQFVQEHTDDDFLDAVARLDEPTTGDVADDIGCAVSTASERLRALESEGALEYREIGTAKLWSVRDA